MTSVPSFVPSDRPVRSSRMIVVADALWTGHPASQTVTRLSVSDGLPAWRTDIGCEPATMDRAESRLFVACFDSGELVVLDDATGEQLLRRWVGHGPFGVLAASGRVYVSLANEDALLALHDDSLAELGRVATDRQPRGLALQGNRLYVVHMLDASVRVWDAESLGPLGEATIGFNSALAESITLHPDTPRAYVAHQRQNVTNMARLFDSTVFPVVSTLDTEALQSVRREALTLDTVDTPVGMPAAVVLGPDGTTLYVVNAASDDMSVVDLEQGLGVGHVAVGHHPREVALSSDGMLLYILNLVSDDVTVVATDTLDVVDTWGASRGPQAGRYPAGGAALSDQPARRDRSRQLDRVRFVPLRRRVRWEDVAGHHGRRAQYPCPAWHR